MIALSLIVAAAGAALQPTSKWQVNFDENQCVASRQYGDANAPLVLMLKAPATSGILQMVISKATPGGARNAAQVEGALAWGTAPGHKISVLRYEPTGRQKLRFYVANVPKADVDAAMAGQASELSFSIKNVSGEAPVTGLHARLAVPSITSVLQLLNECAENLHRHWDQGSDPAAPLKSRAAATQPLPSLFDGDHDYPDTALFGDQSGTTSALLLINEEGRVADCTLTATSGVASLDARTCMILRERARYRPAVAADGKPTRAIDAATIPWVNLGQVP
ncbi:energy transducer TonB [Sphingomonas sp. BN140010]|uniref:Energy transducer TonB n=1 Tax=Sphingomonas arvum TaxID=2992113 RepID=A0ABT3JHJ9_9SPHN|nr:energy transducer TonB [Sphingomonas sp. BN140010]MCW3798562.1 energy transducer TonB [Sphingomonas sp. BN140010]